MNKIKFRCVYKANEKVIFKIYSLDDLKNKSLNDLNESFNNFELLNIDQSTDIKDMHGNEIFHGDIIKCWFKHRRDLEPSIEEVFIFNTNFTLPFSELFDIENKTYKDYFEEYEIIGNVYDKRINK